MAGYWLKLSEVRDYWHIGSPALFFHIFRNPTSLLPLEREFQEKSNGVKISSIAGSIVRLLLLRRFHSVSFSLTWGMFISQNFLQEWARVIINSTNAKKNLSSTEILFKILHLMHRKDKQAC